MADAFRDAELLANALDAGFKGEEPELAALAGYERTRNAAAGPMYEFTLQLSHLEPPPPELQQLFAALQGNPDGIASFLGVIAGTVAILELFSPENVQRLSAA